MSTQPTMTADLTPIGTRLNVEPPADPGRQLETKALTLSEQASAIIIKDQPSYDLAVDFLKGVKALRNEAEAHHRPVIDAAHKAHKAAVEALKRIDAPLEQAERVVKGTMSAWTIEQERIRREEEERLRVEQEKAREAELEAQLERAEAEGATEAETLAMIEQAAMAPAPPPPTVGATYKPAAGVAVRKTYGAEVVNLRALIVWVAQNPAYDYLLKVDQVALNRLATNAKASLVIPGVKVIEKSSVAVR